MFAQNKVYTKAIIPQGDILPCPIEQFPSQSFFDNECGWTRNDIAVLAAATSKSQYDAIVQRLTERKAEFNLKPDTKLVDAFKAITPRWCQSPVEIQQFAEYVAGQSLADLTDDAYRQFRPTDVEQPAEQSAEKAAE